jgi:hypothetical protein
MKNYLFAFLALIVVMFVSSCEKKGCTSDKALNYSQGAFEDDSSCVFYATQVFVIKDQAADSLMQLGIDRLTILIDNIVQEEVVLSPEQLAENEADFETYVCRNLRKENDLSFRYSVVGQNGELLWGGVDDYLYAIIPLGN